MCGISVVWGEVENGEDQVVQQMLERLAHRGPDAEGVYRDPNSNGILGHRRLSIIDPDGGNQPILSNGGRSAIVANGEIYNFQSLRRTIDPRCFRTQSDTETILHLYGQVKDRVVSRLDGMFSFVVTDGDHLFAARDPIGIKPLYVGRRGKSWCFASELKALAGIAEDIGEFPPGTTFDTERGYQQFYRVPEVVPEQRPLGVVCRQLRRTLEEAVVKRLMSDVPLGAFLSGGLDSSIIAAIARRHMEELHTFCVGIEGSQDLEAARCVARYLDTIHHEYVFTRDEVMGHLPEIIYHLESYDQDLVRSAIPCYFTARLAAEHVKVILTGEGADELFAGYEYYRRIDDPTALHQELRRSVCALHNINLQRVDRMTMAHGIEGRVPFLDIAMIELAQTIPPEMKLHRGTRGGPIEKWILRKACEDLLPAEILWRDKKQFDEGSGTVDAVSCGLERWIGRDRASSYTAHHSRARLRSAEECAYHKILTDGYRQSEAILDNVARWSTEGRLS